MRNTCTKCGGNWPSNVKPSRYIKSTCPNCRSFEGYTKKYYGRVVISVFVSTMNKLKRIKRKEQTMDDLINELIREAKR